MQTIQIQGLNAQDLLNKLNSIEEKIDSIHEQPQQVNLPESEQFLTRAQVAELLQVSIQTLITWHKKGVLKGSRIGTRIRYQYSEVKTLLDNLKN